MAGGWKVSTTTWRMISVSRRVWPHYGRHADRMSTEEVRLLWREETDCMQEQKKVQATTSSSPKKTRLRNTLLIQYAVSKHTGTELMDSYYRISFLLNSILHHVYRYRYWLVRYRTYATGSVVEPVYFDPAPASQDGGYGEGSSSSSVSHNFLL